MAQYPDSRLATRTLPAPLCRALVHVFAQEIAGCMLVGGTGLAGYYAGHRRSDDLDLFTRDPDAQRAAVLAVQSLSARGAHIETRQSSAQFFSATCSSEDHVFTAQVVLDANLFAVGASLRAQDGVVVADVNTLLKMKAATVVSRCGEKDLFDLLWLFRERPELELGDLIALGAEIDGGMSAEAALTSLVGAHLRAGACDFAIGQSASEVFEAISTLASQLSVELDRLARELPVPPIGHLIAALKPNE